MVRTEMPTMYFFNDFEHVSGISVQKNSFSEYEYHFHEFYELECVTEGRCTYVLNNESYPVQRGDVLLVTPTDGHAYVKCGDGAVSTVTVHFEISTAIPYMKLKAGVLRGNDALLSCFLRLSEEFFDDLPYKAESLKNLLERILILYAREQRVAPSPLPADIVRAVTYVHRHYAEDVSTARVSELCGYSESHFCRKFKRHTHYSFISYLNRVRLLNAARLLCGAQTLSVSQIAEKCGFPCIRQFNRAFAKKFGCAPSEYRKRSK